MAISGSTDFTVNRTQVIDGALRAIGVLRDGDTVTNHTNWENDSAQSLNLMIKSWHNLGMQLWTRKTQAVTLTESQASYTLAPSGGDVTMDVPLRVLSAYRTESNIDTQLTLMTRDEYDTLNNKTQEGTPVNFFYDYQNTSGTLYLWPVPDSNAETNITITIIYHKPYDDMDAAANTLDFPQSWEEAVKWNLAARLAPEFGRQTPQEVVSLAINTLKYALESGYEEGSVYFQPRMR